MGYSAKVKIGYACRRHCRLLEAECGCNGYGFAGNEPYLMILLGHE
jgi:hypothetical protein